MNRLTIVVLIAVVICVSIFRSTTFVSAQTPTPSPLDKSLSKQLDKSLSNYMSSKNHVPGLAVAVISIPDASNQPQVSEFFYGTTKKGAKQLPDSSTIFGIGSESKVFTAVLLAGFVEDGQVKLSDPIQKYLPADVHAPTYQGKQITLLDLATHRSGLPDSPSNKGKGKNKADPSDYSLQDLYDWLNSYQLTRAPGSQWEYSNIGFGLLGTLLSTLANQSYDDLMDKYMGTPLDMPDTVVFLSPEQLKRAAQGYDGSGQPAEMMTTKSSSEVIGGGQLSSTISDMEHFMEANLGVLGDKRTTAIFDLTQKIVADGNNDNARMGLGWQIAMPKKNQTAPRYWKDGEASGFHSFMTFIKDKGQKVAVAMLGNGIDSGSGFEPLGVQMLNLVDGVGN